MESFFENFKNASGISCKESPKINISIQEVAISARSTEEYEVWRKSAECFSR